MRITEKRFGKFIVEAETGINRLFLNLNTPQTEKKDGQTDRPTDRKADQETITHVFATGCSGKIVFFHNSQGGKLSRILEKKHNI